MNQNMHENELSIQDICELRDFVQQQLCLQNELEVGAFLFTERVLHQSDSPCGLFFCLHGPRSVKLIAIWETHRNAIHFYGSNGERVQSIRLATAPPLAA